MYLLAGTCITKPGHGVPNAPCVFPWKYEDDQTVYEGCANPSNSAVGLWCPTELDDEGKYVSGKWGVCVDSCPGKVDTVQVLNLAHRELKARSRRTCCSVIYLSQFLQVLQTLAWPSLAKEFLGNVCFPGSTNAIPSLARELELQNVCFPGSMEMTRLNIQGVQIQVSPALDCGVRLS